MTNKRIKKIRFFISIMLLMFLQTFSSYAGNQNKRSYAYLYFYTIDGDPIDSLTKKIRTDQSYTFRDPDQYKYIVYKDGNGNVIRGENDDLYDSVKGIEWWDETDTNDYVKYTAGQTTTLTEGDHYFRVHTDNSSITGENLQIADKEDIVQLSFYDENWNPIMNGQDYSYDKTITTRDTFQFPDPKETCENGIYWACTDENGENVKQYLFKKGEKVKFKGGDYAFHIATSDPVEVSFYYPLGQLAVENHDAGDVYGETITGKVGDTVTLYKSPGAVVWGSTFKGWEDDSDSGNVYAGGTQYKIMDNGEIHFTMVYEEDDDWDPFAKDENEGMVNGKLMKTSDEVNKTGGTGYATYIDANGKLATKYTPRTVNSESAIKGVPSNIKKDKNLTSLKEGGDPSNPEDYEYDKYGNKMSESKINDPDMGDVLRQDNSAQYMDVYGNSMIYHDDLSRIDDMCVAWIRLYEMKNSVPSFAAMIKDWDQEEINRYEAIEFALLSQEYPGNENSVYKRWNSDDEDVVAAKNKGAEFGLTKDTKLPEWKNEYMSERAFNMLKYTKTIFSGWCDTYDDGVYELYKGNGGNIQTVGMIGRFKGISRTFTKSISNTLKNFSFSSIRDLFMVTAYAEKNDLSTAKQYGTYITQSLDSEKQTFHIRYFDKSKISRFSAYSFGALDGLTGEEIETMQTIYNFLISKGFSEAMAAGACGNIWQECGFNPSTGLSGTEKSAIGIVQWMGDRKSNLKKFAVTKGKTAADINVQLEFMMNEINSSYITNINKFIAKRAPGQTTATITDVQLATDAWCAVYEGCVCITKSGLHKSHSSNCAVAANGISYQELGTRRRHAESIANAGTSGSTEGGGINTPLVTFAKTFLGVKYRWGGSGPQGFDCSGFARYVLNHFGAGISGTSSELSRNAGRDVEINPSTMLPGDLIFYAGTKGVNHVTIYIGNGLMIGANGSPTVKNAKGQYVIGAYGKGDVSIKQYNYRTPVRVRRCFDITNKSVYGMATDKDKKEEN